MAGGSARPAAGDACGRVSSQHDRPRRLRHLVTELGKGLSEEGFVEGRNVIIEQRWGDNQPDRLPGLAADLVRRKAAVIVGNTPAVFAAVRVAGPTVPLVFVVVMIR